MRLLVIAGIASVLLLLAANLAPVYGYVSYRCRPGGYGCVPLAKRKEKTFKIRDRCCYLGADDECPPNNKCPYEGAGYVNHVCADKDIRIKCEKGSNIKISSASYGSVNSDVAVCGWQPGGTCRCPGNGVGDERDGNLCQSEDKTRRILAGKCDNQQTCSVKVHWRTFGMSEYDDCGSWVRNFVDLVVKEKFYAAYIYNLHYYCNGESIPTAEPTPPPGPCFQHICPKYKTCHAIEGKAVCNCQYNCAPGEYKPICVWYLERPPEGGRYEFKKEITFDNACLYKQERCSVQNTWFATELGDCATNLKERLTKDDSSGDGDDDDFSDFLDDDDSIESSGMGNIIPSEDIGQSEGSSTIRHSSTVPKLQKPENEEMKENKNVEDTEKGGAQSHQLLLIHTKIERAVVLMISTLLPLLMMQQLLK